MAEHTSDRARLLYLDLLKGCLTRSLFPEKEMPAAISPALRTRPIVWTLSSNLNRFLKLFRLQLSSLYRPELRARGDDWPVAAETMIGLARLQNLQDCLTDILVQGVPGDLIETGVWRGGACIFMRAMLEAYDVRDRAVWVCDSFEGVPKPDARYFQDAGDNHWTYADYLAVPLEEVRANFARYGLLDERVKFLKGWFKDTLPAAPIERLALLRLDGDMYSSTMDVLEHLYPKLSPRGYVIVDDYGILRGCQQAVEDYRARHGIAEPICSIDRSGVFWQKESALAARA